VEELITLNNVNSLSSLIWSSADDVLRGLFKPSEYGRVILPFVVMRRLDCVLEPKKDETYNLYESYKNRLSDPSPVILKQVGLPFFNYSKYDLTRIKSDPNNVLMNFNNYVHGYSPNVLDIIENFSIDPLVEKLHKNKRLYLLIDKFTEFDLHPSVIDNHQMGSVYEELLRKFSEMSNEESGDHFTPRDVVKLLVSFVFGGDREDLSGEGKIRSVFDPCCGTGGMLTIGKQWVHQNINPNLKIDLYGQELNDVTYSICKSDFLMMDENPDNIHGPCSCISDDRLQGRKFDYMITNPPFGVSWKSERSFVEGEKKDPNGRFFVGTSRVSDGSLLFLQHLIHKMNPEGSRIGIVFNGSPLFTGDAGSGEANIRKWIIENDWLECIVSLPDRMFFNTGITTYIWIVTNKKSKTRRGKVQLINGTSFFTGMKKNLGDKGKYISDDQIQTLFDIYQSNKEGGFCKIFPNEFFGYTKVVVEQPLIENGDIRTDKKGNTKPDTKKRDSERVPLTQDVDEYYQREVQPHLPDSWVDRSKDKIGYEINFTKYFYEFTSLRSLEEITHDLKSLDDKIKLLSMEIING
jgi:type I restriction enzyme M protein